MARFLLDLPFAGRPPRLQLDGKDVPDVTAVRVDAASDDVTRIYVTLAAGGTIDGEGVVHVVENLDQRQVVLRWLQAIDPELFGKAILDRAAPGVPTPVAALEALRSWAQGADVARTSRLTCIVCEGCVEMVDGHPHHVDPPVAGRAHKAVPQGA